MTRRTGTATSLAALAAQLGAELHGEDAIVDGAAALDAAGARDIAYLADRKFRDAVARCRAAAVIVPPDEVFVGGPRLLVAANPRLAFARALTLIFPEPPAQAGIHPSALVDATAVVAASAEVGAYVSLGAASAVGAGTVIGPGCRIGARVRIGDDVRLLAGVTILDGCVLGDRCVVQPGAVIGSDGFGYARDQAVWVKMLQLGRVVIGDDVEIGANTTIDRGALGDTYIGNGVKLDNLIQVAHNVHIGEHTAVAACVGIAGSARIGARCMIGGGAGIGGHLEIADDVTILGKTSITNSIRTAGVYSSTMSAQPAPEWRKNAVRFRHLDDFVRTLKKLESQVQQLLSGRSRG